MLNLHDVVGPSLVLDESKARANIRFMAEVAKTHQLIFRPHFKTHQSAYVGNWFRDEGVTKITVSNVEMAIYFAHQGWDDITLAMPVNVRDLQRIKHLASLIQLNLVIEDIETVYRLQRELSSPCAVFLKIDTGYGRAGIPWDDGNKIKTIIKQLICRKNTRFAGFLWHDGHTYKARNVAEIQSIRLQTLERLRFLKSVAEEFGIQTLFSGGDTPSCSICDDFTGIDEIRPGNFVFYDCMQQQLGSCTHEQIAVALLCPVLSVYTDRKQVLVHAGAVHLSKESLATSTTTLFGKVVALNPDISWGKPIENTALCSISQEHGIIAGPADWLNTLKPGDLLGILPVHSCLTVACMGGYTLTNGKQISMYCE